METMNTIFELKTTKTSENPRSQLHKTTWRNQECYFWANS